MEKERKIKLMEYLFPSQSAREFLCNDAYQEILGALPPRICISTKNLAEETRLKNLNYVKCKILSFLAVNFDCKNEILKIYKKDRLQDVLEDVLIGCVFYLSQTKNKYKNIDIFKDKRSICFDPLSIIDVM